MKKDINKKNDNKIYAIVVIVVAALVLFVIFKPNHEVKSTEKAEAITAETTKTKEEKVISRIDFGTKLVDADKPQFEVYVDGSETPMKQAAWMPNFNSQGYVIQTDDGSKDIKLKALTDADISIVLRGRWDINADGKMIEHWVEYTSFVIDNQEILNKPINVWHNKPFVYKFNTKNGQEYKIHIEWQAPEEHEDNN